MSYKDCLEPYGNEELEDIACAIEDGDAQSAVRQPLPA